MGNDYEISLVSKHQCQNGQSPYWDESKQKLLFVDRDAGCGVRLDPDTATDVAMANCEGTIGFILPIKNEKNNVLLGHNHYIRKYDMKRHKNVELIAYVEPENILVNICTGKCDPKGRLWVSTMPIEHKSCEIDLGLATLVRLDGKAIKRQAEGFSMPNGIGWSTDSSKIFVSDALPDGIIAAYDYDASTGNILDSSHKTVVADFKKKTYLNYGFPGGIAIDADNKIWAACMKSGYVIQMDPETGSILTKIQLSVTMTTSLCFGGEDYTELYVTTAFTGLSTNEIKEQPKCGSVFKITGPSLKGQQSHPFEM